MMWLKMECFHGCSYSLSSATSQTAVSGTPTNIFSTHSAMIYDGHVSHKMAMILQKHLSWKTSKTL